MLVIGTGLIGTSAALAARRAGVAVFLSDRDPGAARIAESLGAGSADSPPATVDLAVLAVPPSAIGPVLRQAQAGRLAVSYTDVAGVKGLPERDARLLAPDPGSFVGGHPMAGRERSGPLAARADLFAGCPWVLCPSAVTGRSTLDRARALTTLCGAVPVVLPSGMHDDTVALTSHVPHLVASLMAARLAAGPAGAGRFAGRGARDVTRIAAGDPALWSDIVEANASAIAPVLRDLQADLSQLLEAVEALSARGAAGRSTLLDLLERGVAGVSQTWRADGADHRAGAAPEVIVRIDGQPGELGRLLAGAVALGVDADQVRAELANDGGLVVRIGGGRSAERVVTGLRSAGWEITPAEGLPSFSEYYSR